MKGTDYQRNCNVIGGSCTISTKNSCQALDAQPATKSPIRNCGCIITRHAWAFNNLQEVSLTGSPAGRRTTRKNFNSLKYRGLQAIPILPLLRTPITLKYVAHTCASQRKMQDPPHHKGVRVPTRDILRLQKIA